MNNYHWTRKAYSGRGKLQMRDYTLEKIIAPACVICNKTLKRKLSRQGRLETMERFENRKTCGMIVIDRWLKKSECLKKFLCGAGNPNFKNIMPQCISCDKKINTYPSKNAKGLRCMNCEYENRKGKWPEKLKPFAWKKGQEATGTPFKKGNTPWNKKTYGTY